MCGIFAGLELLEKEVDGAMMFLCPKCAKFGSSTTKAGQSTKDKQQTEVTFVRNKPDGKGAVTQQVTVRAGGRNEPLQKKRKHRDALDTDKELIDNFGAIIKNARIAQGLSLEELAQLINEKASILQKIEKNEFNPSDQLIAKIERKLQITLKEEAPATVYLGTTTSKETTLGDIVKLRKKK